MDSSLGNKHRWRPQRSGSPARKSGRLRFLFFIDLIANGKPASFLKETGAGSLIITTKYVKSWGTVNQNEILVGASGTELKVKEIANIHINLGHRHQFTIPMHVMQKFAFDGFLGNEFLNNHVKLIDYGAQTWHFNYGSIARFRFHTNP